uniref:testican-1-like n=1 Tax=Halichoerus grypus TaxID=9711 RepID=UPI0016595B04|nr:testican-1-like [Halichoerus grypus]
MERCFTIVSAPQMKYLRACVLRSSEPGEDLFEATEEVLVVLLYGDLFLGTKAKQVNYSIVFVESLHSFKASSVSPLQCKLEFHACSTGKSLTILCDGPCPCLPEPEPPKHKTEKNACTDKELRNLASRLKDWFGALHEDANRVIKPTSSDAAQGRFDTSILPICKDSLGWMFNKLDMNYDLLLDHSEINAIYLDKYEPCIKPLFNSCDSFKDGKLSNNEWCYCFQKPGGLPCQNEMNRIQKLSKGKSLLGAFIPRCNEEGYYKATQCHGSTGQCWCVDKYGNELAGSRKQGAVSCEEEQETSGDFGSGGSVVLLDDLEDERELGPKDTLGKLRVHTRAVTEDDEDEDDDKEDEVGYIW